MGVALAEGRAPRVSRSSNQTRDESRVTNGEENRLNPVLPLVRVNPVRDTHAGSKVTQIPVARHGSREIRTKRRLDERRRSKFEQSESQSMITQKTRILAMNRLLYVRARGAKPIDHSEIKFPLVPRTLENPTGRSSREPVNSKIPLGNRGRESR